MSARIAGMQRTVLLVNQSAVGSGSGSCMQPTLPPFRHLGGSSGSLRSMQVALLSAKQDGWRPALVGQQRVAAAAAASCCCTAAVVALPCR